MDLGGPLIAAIVAAIGGLVAVAYKHDRKWPVVRELTRFVLDYLWKTGLGIVIGVYLGWVFPKQAETIYWWVFAAFGITFALFLLVEFANWLRDP